jgi:para-aminobenzoate synthetase
LRTLLVDNHDSYTFNLFQLIAQVTGTEPVVLANDDPALLSAEADNIVISPGPGRPEHPRDIGYIPDLLLRATVPVLGVCLGHQALAWHEGASIVTAPQPRHGHLSTIKHDGDDLFAGLPPEFTAVRYHSLCVAEPLPDTLAAIARAEDGVIMAIRHRTLPRWGVQFHPESIATEHGRQLLANFAASARTLRLATRKIRTTADPETIFAALTPPIWLDSNSEHNDPCYSFLAAAPGPLGETLTYRSGTGEVEVSDAAGTRTEEGTIFEVLDQRLRKFRVDTHDLPFDFTCGYVGYFGYELKADCGADRVHTAATPDAVWILADRLIALDHQAGDTYLLALHDATPQLRASAETWLRDTEHRLAALPPATPAPAPHTAAMVPSRPFDSGWDRGRERYLADIAACQRELINGESYEICLTDTVRLPFHDDDLAFYRRLRRLNPAPYGAFFRAAGVTVFSSSPERFLRIGRDGRVESKPIKGTARRHADPARDAREAQALARDPKTRAENLMITDLLRNDLGRVCEVGSVAVERYMAVESYATVHQLVSTITGRLKPEVSPVQCVRACFPGGSMTGAPKLRTMEIIDRLETRARGVYSGALGYFGLSGGADLSIVIRAAVRYGDTLTVGAGGAIVLDSCPQDEYEEMLLKAAATLRAYSGDPGGDDLG